MFSGLSDEEAVALKDDLPAFSFDVPLSIRDLVASLRCKNPRQRPSAAFAKSVDLITTNR